PDRLEDLGEHRRGRATGGRTTGGRTGAPHGEGRNAGAGGREGIAEGREGAAGGSEGAAGAGRRTGTAGGRERASQAGRGKNRKRTRKGKKHPAGEETFSEGCSGKGKTDLPGGS